MSCVIPDGAKVKILNGKIQWHGREYSQSDCTIGEGVTFTTEVKEIDVNEEEQPKPKKKKPAPKAEQKADQPSENMEIENTNLPSHKDIDMGLPALQVPQDQTPGMGQPVQQQMPMQPQQMQPVQQQMPIQQQMPQGLPQGFTVPPQFQQQFQQYQQQFQPPQQLHNEVQQPQDGLNINLIKQIMDLAQGNVAVMGVLIAGYLGFTWMKKMEKIKEKEAENGGQHATACDNDRKNLNSKFTDIDFKVQKIDMLENKVKQMGDVNGRLTKLEENSNGLTFNDTSELEEALAKVVKKVESLDKKIATLVGNAPAPATTVKKPAKKETKSIVEFPPEDEDDL